MLSSGSGNDLEAAFFEDGALQTALFEPFEIPRRSNQESHRKEKENGGSGRDLEIWRPRTDSNHEPFRLWMIDYRRAPQVPNKGNRGRVNGRAAGPSYSGSAKLNSTPAEEMATYCLPSTA